MELGRGELQMETSGLHMKPAALALIDADGTRLSGVPLAVWVRCQRQNAALSGPAYAQSMDMTPSS